MTEFKALGKSGAKFEGLEVFPISRAPGSTQITFETDGPTLTAFCPVTHQPDYYHVTISYVPRGKALESKSLKLYLESLRDQEGFAEDLCHQICQDLTYALDPLELTVSLTQNVRGGLRLRVRESYDNYPI